MTITVFYKDELTLFKALLTDEYGEYLVSCEIRDKIEYTKEVLTQLIEAHKEYGVNDLEDVVTLNVAFTVSGNGKERRMEIVNTGWIPKAWNRGTKRISRYRIVRPENMERITTAVPAEKLIVEKSEDIRAHVDDNSLIL